VVKRGAQVRDGALGRSPTPPASTYHRNIIQNGWDEHHVRQALRRSPERRQRRTVSDAEATEIVRRAYL
jgi:hypothetical protein